MKPTYLYIKQHNKTGLLYFGKTTNNPEIYQGSGLHWLRHLKVHGARDVTTLWYCLFTERDELVKFATLFSVSNNIVESVDWANLKPENGLDGGSLKGRPYKPFPEQSKINLRKPKYSNKNYLKPKSEEHRKKLAEHLSKFRTTNIGELNPHYGHKHTDEAKRLMSEKAKNRPKFECQFCHRHLVKQQIVRNHQNGQCLLKTKN